MSAALELFVLALHALLVALFVERSYFVADRRSFEGERYVELCAGEKQNPFSFVCVQVAR